MLMPSCIIYTEEAKLMYPQDPNKYPLFAAIFWLTIFWIIVAWWFLYI